MHCLFYRECIADLQIVNDWLSPMGTVIMCGDFNGRLHVKHGHHDEWAANARGLILSTFLKYNNMYSTIAHNSRTGLDLHVILVILVINHHK